MPRTAKRHDTLDPITGTATAGGSPVDLTVFTSVKLFATNGTVTFSGECAEANADGTWVYEQTDANMGDIGTFEIELECTNAAGKKVHFPSAEPTNPILTIGADIDDA